MGTIISRATRGKNGRQGVRYVVQEGMEVLDSQTMLPVPRDGKTMGEICFGKYNDERVPKEPERD